MTATMNFGSRGLGGAMATFGGQTNPACNYTSPLARKFVYKEQNQVHRPLRRHIFRLKVRTAAELRFNEIVKKYMHEKMTFKRGVHAASTTNNLDIDHMGSVIPKDEYEIRKLTSYVTSKKMSADYRNHMQEIWTKVYFYCEAHNAVGQPETAFYQNSRIGTDEEYMTFMWYAIFTTTLFSFVVTAIWWWWKYGQAPEYVELN